MIYPEIENYELVLANLDFDPIYLDDFDAHMEEQREMMNTLLYTRYGQNDILTNVPSCACKELHKQDDLGLRCTVCGTLCSPTYSRKIEPTLWSRVPDGITSFVNPLIWQMMKTLFRSRSNNILLWLTDPYYKPPSPDDPKIRRLEAMLEEIPNFRRGLNYFVEKYDEIIDQLLERKILGQRYIEQTEFLAFSRENKDCFFTTVLPVINRYSFIVEQSGTANFTDTKALSGVDVFLTINNLHHSRQRLSIARKESAVVNCLNELANHNEKYLVDKIFPKPGQIRKHLVGSRAHFTARAVITSLHDQHHYWEIHVPWGIAVEFLKEHIRSKLIHNYNMSPNDVVDLIATHVTKYHPLLDKVLKELIAEAPYYTRDGIHKGIPIVFNRNPTNTRGSVIMLYISSIKTDVDRHGSFLDSTLSLSIAVITALNADQHLVLILIMC